MGVIDYIKDNKIQNSVSVRMVMVESKEEAETKLTEYHPGTIAFTAGYKTMWQKKTDGTWADFD